MKVWGPALIGEMEVAPGTLSLSLKQGRTPALPRVCPNVMGAAPVQLFIPPRATLLTPVLRGLSLMVSCAQCSLSLSMWHLQCPLLGNVRAHNSPTNKVRRLGLVTHGTLRLYRVGLISALPHGEMGTITPALPDCWADYVLGM